MLVLESKLFLHFLLRLKTTSCGWQCVLQYELFINNNLEVLPTLHLGHHPLEVSAQGFPFPKRILMGLAKSLCDVTCSRV